MSLLFLLSPAKKQAFSAPDIKYRATQPRLRTKTAILVNILKNLNADDLATQLHISTKLAELNTQRYQTFNVDEYNKDNASPCLWTFQGDVYRMLDTKSLTVQDAAYAQNHLRILSGLYGLLRPLDLIQPYRLEMGCKITTGKGTKLYDFWSTEITNLLNKDISNDTTHILNLASKEYSQAIQQQNLKKPMIDIIFRQQRQGKLQNIGLLAKRARGQMTRFIIEQQLSDINQVKKFNIDGYQYSAASSNEKELAFISKKI
ncbi:MAG: peroxide stress protein YaaA [Gammaproteobacteria bacterium]